MLKQRRCATFLWCGQVDAAADGEAEAKLDDSGGLRCSGVTRRKKRRKGNGKKRKGILIPIYKGKEISDRCGNRGAQKMNI